MKKLFTALLLVFVAIFNLIAEEPKWFADKLPEKITNKAKKEIATSAALHGKTVALYFSASWCPPCRGFTPQLINFYKKVKDKNFEIIFVSSDKNEQEMLKYFKKMPWLAIPFKDPARAKLKSQFKVNGIPTLIVLGHDGKVISSNARWDVVMLGEKALTAWQSEDYKPKTYADYQKENKSKDKAVKKSKKSKKSKK